ncbi:MAG: carboxypeptidase-like regulatory domain-containing protein, partial [Candidatus Angelobacter sp.]
MLKKVAFSPLMLPLLIVMFAASAFAQTTASIQGTVSDQSGAAVVGAKVTVKNTALGIERTTQTSSTGSYEVPALPPGTYSVQV